MDHKSIVKIFSQKELNMQQRRSIELFSDYDCEIRYHPGKVNVVAHALSRKETVKPKRIGAMNMTLQSSIMDRILSAQKGAIDESARLQKGADKMYYDLRNRKCHSPIMWTEVGEDQLIGPELVQDTSEKISLIKDRLKAARVVYFRKKEKLPPRFVGPFKIIKKVGPVAYQLDLLEKLNDGHDTFHMSKLKKCLADPTLHVPLDEIQVDAKLNFMKVPIEISEREFKKLKRSRIVIIKILYHVDSDHFYENCGNRYNKKDKIQAKSKETEKKTKSVEKSKVKPDKVKAKKIKKSKEIKLSAEFTNSAKNLFPLLDNPKLTIQRRSRSDPTLLNNSEMAAERNDDLPVPDLRTMEEFCQPSLNGRGGLNTPIAIQATNFGLKNDMIQQVQNSCQFHVLP
nr:reverse transcriptase domain-containing protein [Tanacetum cinerariifolium]